jgi:hypothetical protein
MGGLTSSRFTDRLYALFEFTTKTLSIELLSKLLELPAEFLDLLAHFISGLFQSDQALVIRRMVQDGWFDFGKHLPA